MTWSGAPGERVGAAARWPHRIDTTQDGHHSSLRASTAATLVRSAGTSSAANHDWLRNQPSLRGLGCGSGITFGAKARHARTHSVSAARSRHSGAHSGRGPNGRCSAHPARLP